MESREFHRTCHTSTCIRAELRLKSFESSGQAKGQAMGDDLLDEFCTVLELD